MKTLVFCTAFADSAAAWNERYRPWLRAIRDTRLAASQIMLVDDGSPCLPDWPRLRIVPEPAMPDISPGEAILYHFEHHLGRQGVLNFPGWYRSFAFAAAYAEANGFDKVIHIESDAYLISARAKTLFRTLREGWITVRAPKYDCSEIALQAAAGESLRHMREFFAQPYEQLIGRSHEFALPYTHIDTTLRGDRYGEQDGEVPWDADYAAQLQIWNEPEGGWWLGSPRRAANASLPLQGRLRMDFGDATTVAHFLGQGWSTQEETQRWMIGDTSEISLPPMPAPKDYHLRLHLLPHVAHGRPAQRLALRLNAIDAARFTIAQAGAYHAVLPRDAIRANSANRLQLFHPDGFSPNQAHGDADTRQLSLAVAHLGLQLGRPGALPAPGPRWGEAPQTSAN